MADTNYTKYSSCNVAFPKGAATETEYASKSKLAKVGTGGSRRPAQYTLESFKK